MVWCDDRDPLPFLVDREEDIIDYVSSIVWAINVGLVMLIVILEGDVPVLKEFVNLFFGAAVLRAPSDFPDQALNVSFACRTLEHVV